MQPQDTEIFTAWMKGESVGSIAKRHKLDKSQIRKIVNRHMERRSSEHQSQGDDNGQRD